MGIAQKYGSMSGYMAYILTSTYLRAYEQVCPISPQMKL